MMHKPHLKTLCSLRGAAPARLLLILLCAVPLVAAPPTVWVVGSMERVGQTDPAGGDSRAEIWAAKGEYESFQIVVRAPSGGLTGVNVQVSDLAGPSGAVIPASSLTLFREHYVYVNEASPDWRGSNRPLGRGWYADGLIPFRDPTTGMELSGATLDAVPFSLAANNNQPIWVDVLVPRTAPAGLYTGTYTVTSNQGSTDGQITLHVWNFTLPHKPSLKSSFLVWESNNLQTREELLRNRMQPGGVPANQQRHLIDDFGLGMGDTGFWSGADNSSCRLSSPPSVSQIQAARSRIQPDLEVYNYTADEIDECPPLTESVKAWARNLHQAGVKNLITMAPTPTLYDDGSGSGRSAVDIWVVLPVMYDGAVSAVNHVIGKGDDVWSYNTLVQDSYSPKWEIDFSPANFRIQPGMLNQALNLTGLLYWRVDLWNSDPWNQVNNQGVFESSNYPGDGMLVYPGTQVGIQGVAPSMRLKYLRDGADDFDYIALLRQAGRTDWARQVARQVAPDWRNWTRSASAIEDARRQLGDELDRLSGGAGAPPTNTDPPANNPPANNNPPTTEGPPEAVSVSPSSGKGANQMFQLQYSDPNGYAQMATASVLFHTQMNAAGGCYLQYNSAQRTVSLQNDTGTGWLGSIALGSSATVQNSQCSIQASGSSASGYGTLLLVNLAITFQNSFTGEKKIYMYAADTTARNSGWQMRGTWTPATEQSAPASAPEVVSVSPSSGRGSSQVFRFTYSHEDGFQQLGPVFALINSDKSAANGCQIQYDRAQNALWLMNDAGTSWLGPLPIGSWASVSNRQCRISAWGSNASGYGSRLQVQLNISFRRAFQGNKQIYMFATDTGGQGSGWQRMGTFRVTRW